MFCKRCGTNNPNVARFCENCGTNLTGGKYAPMKKAEDAEKDVPVSLIVAVIIVIFVVSAIFVVLSLFKG